jgi:hypothetical protein
MLERLTPAQERLLPVVREEWLQVALSTQPADRAMAEHGVRLVYQAAGLAAPRTVIWVGSPRAGCVAAAMLDEQQVKGRYWGQLGEQVAFRYWHSVDAQVAEQVSAQVGTPVGDRTGRQLIDEFGQQVAAVLRQLRQQVLPELWERVDQQVRELIDAHVVQEVREAVRGQLWLDVVGSSRRAHRDRDELDTAVPVPGQHGADLLSLYAPYVQAPHAVVLPGQHEAGWIAVLAYLALAAPELTGAQLLHGHVLVARAAGWWWPFERAVILTERPRRLHRDEQGRLHRTDGPAIAYPDGFAVWAWHGVHVPTYVVEAPESITVDEIQAEGNVEVRRVMLDRYGPGRYLRDAGAGRVHADNIGTLWRLEQRDDEPLVMVEVVNATPELDGTRRTYWLRVPPQVRTARQAVAWTFGLDEHDYQPTVQT